MYTRRLRVNEVDLEILEEGAGGRPLLLAHGYTGTKEDFADHVDALASQGWHVVAPDHRGHGGSDHPDGEESYSLRTFAADLMALVEALGWGRFCLLGHSMGGMIAQHVALAHPQRLTGLILMDTGHGPVEGIDPALLELGRQVVAQGGMEAMVEVMRQTGPSPLDTPAHLRLLDERPGYREFCDAKVLRASPDMWISLSRELFSQPDRLDRLATLRVPTLVVVGDQDAPFLAAAERMAGAIAGARLAVIPDAGHCPQFENPDAWFAAVSSFLDDVVAAEPAPSAQGIGG